MNYIKQHGCEEVKNIKKGLKSTFGMIKNVFIKPKVK
jgi:hypothetical protein